MEMAGLDSEKVCTYVNFVNQEKYLVGQNVYIIINSSRGTQWHTPMILGLGRLRQEDPEFGISLGYIVSLRAVRGYIIKLYQNKNSPKG